MGRMNFILLDEQEKTLRNLEKRTGVSMSEHIRRAFDFYPFAQPQVSGQFIKGIEVLVTTNSGTIRFGGMRG